MSKLEFKLRDRQSIDFAESERQKSKNLFNINNVKTYIGNVVTSVNGNEITISNSTGWGQVSYLIDVKPNTDYVLSVQDINVITQSDGTGKIGIYRGSDNSYITEIYATERTRTFNSGAETQITVYLTSTSWGVEGSGKAKYTGIQLEEGTVATDYQPYNGATIREKQIADVEHIETIYDRASSDSNINKGFTSGLQFSANQTYSVMSQSQKNKYKYFRVTAHLVNTDLIFEFMNNVDGYARGGFACQAGWIDYQSFCFGHIAIASWGTMNLSNCETQLGSTATNQKDNSSYYISKIEGVY